MRAPQSPSIAAFAPGGSDSRVLPASLSMAKPHLLSPGLIRSLSVAIAGLGLALMLITLRPFAAASLFDSVSDRPGDQLNQIGFLAAGTISLLALLCLANRKVLASLLTPGFMLLGLVLAFNLIRSPDQDATLRALVLTLIGMLIAFTVIALPRGEADFKRALTIGAGAALALSYAGLVLFPDLAIHGYDAYEPQHSGLWRGHFSHKNIAGPVMCAIAIFGVYLMRSGQRLSGFVMFAAAAVFVVQTGSKTTAGLFPISILIVMLAPAFGRAGVAILATLLAIAGAGILTLGTLYSRTLAYRIGDLLGDDTYTGRTTLWEFSLSMIPQKPWLGYGLYNFWTTENVLGLEKPYEAAWDYRNIVHGHNNYLDIVLNLGVIGGAVLIWVLFFAPMLNYARARRNPGNRKLADMFFMIIVFAGLLSYLETFFLARNDSIWLMHIFAVFGLHLLARFDIAGPPPGPRLNRRRPFSPA
jgi:O-antigen ligase